MSSFSILTVCTGNICRSPLAEQLLRAGTAQWSQVSVASAGTGALVGQAMPAQSEALSQEFGGLGFESHAGRALTVEMLREADLVIALSREHRAAIAAMLPRASRQLFTLRELARVLTEVPQNEFDVIAALPRGDVSARLMELVEVAASLRGMVAPPESPELDDVVDPYRQSDAVYRESADQLVPAVNQILSQFERAVTAVP